MSEDTPQTPDNDGALDLSALNFGPAWAREDAESKTVKKFKNRGDRDDTRGGRGDRRGGGGRGDNRGGGGRGDRRGGGGGFGGGGGGFKGKGGRRDDRRPPQRQEVEPPAGVSMKLMPAEESLDLLAKQVADTGRTFSVFDLAKVLLQKRDRFRVTFESSAQKLIRCREDNSLWVSRDEALRHLWRGEWRKKFYQEVQAEGEAPKGSFSSVAKCGISGELLGPPNYHGYQQNIATLHRERFSHMSIDAYKAKVRMEHGEEAVEAWLESMKTVTKWKVGPEPEEEKEEAPVEEASAAEEAPKTEEAAEVPDQPEPSEESEENSDAPDVSDDATEETAPAEEKPAAEEAPVSEESESSPEAAPAPEEELLSDMREVERHFGENHFNEVFEETERAWVIGDIAGNLLSPGLLTLLKRTVAEEKRYPANLMPVVCRQLSGRHVAVFKWDKKLKVGPSRPHAVSANTTLAERPQAIINFLKENSGKQLKDLWGALLPKDASDEVKHEWFHDLHWLLNQGHAILLSDTTLHLSKSGDQDQQPKKKSGKKKSAKKKVAEPAAKEEIPKPESSEKPEEPKSETETEVKTEPAVEAAPEAESKTEAKAAPSEKPAPEATPSPETPADPEKE